MSSKWKWNLARYKQDENRTTWELHKPGDVYLDEGITETVLVLTEADVTELEKAVAALTSPNRNFFTVEEVKETIRTILNPEAK